MGICVKIDLNLHPISCRGILYLGREEEENKKTGGDVNGKSKQ